MLSNLSIAAPAYNEGGGICPLVESWVHFLKARFGPEDFEIVICDDGSKDNTWELLSGLARAYPSVKPCRHPVNQGAGAALATAISHTTKKWVLLLDADGQYPIENLDLFLREMESAPALAYIGYRPEKADSAFARFGSWISGQCCNWCHGTRYRDFNCALKLVDGTLLRDLDLEAKGLNYSTEISSKILERGVAMKEIAIDHRAREKGRSSRTLLRGSVQRFLFVSYIGWRQFLFKIGLLQRRTHPPS
ncbi:MAG: glycosyltransferase family 2 protein [Methylacidiphilales bacterium]|nr:glycosyltransferase family 2 protein [Candidatus Methylacidiphilales bacterium]